MKWFWDSLIANTFTSIFSDMAKNAERASIVIKNAGNGQRTYYSTDRQQQVQMTLMGKLWVLFVLFSSRWSERMFTNDHSFFVFKF